MAGAAAASGTAGGLTRRIARRLAEAFAAGYVVEGFVRSDPGTSRRGAYVLRRERAETSE